MHISGKISYCLSFSHIQTIERTELIIKLHMYVCAQNDYSYTNL